MFPPLSLFPQLARYSGVFQSPFPSPPNKVELREKSPRCAAKFIGLTKEELSTFADDPFWVRTRRVLFIAFWVVWLAMIVAAATIIAVSPQCPARPPQKWWDAGVVYRINVKSYKVRVREIMYLDASYNLCG